jgi:hypothetical protein
VEERPKVAVEEDVLAAVNARRRRQSRNLMPRWPITSLLVKAMPMLLPLAERRALQRRPVATPPWTMRCFEQFPCHSVLARLPPRLKPPVNGMFIFANLSFLFRSVFVHLLLPLDRLAADNLRHETRNLAVHHLCAVSIRPNKLFSRSWVAEIKIELDST